MASSPIKSGSSGGTAAATTTTTTTSTTMAAEPQAPTPRALLTEIIRTIEATPAVGYDLIVKNKDENNRQAVQKQQFQMKMNKKRRWREEEEDEDEEEEEEEKEEDESDENDDDGEGEEQAKPQRSALPNSHRRLIMTLHTILPTLVMPALDILDRGLLTRLVPTRPRSNDHDESTAHQGIYIARSLASTLPRRGREPGGGGGQEGEDEEQQQAKALKRYVVRVGAWNCTCAEFATSTFRQDDEWRDVDGQVMDTAGDYGGAAIMTAMEHQGGGVEMGAKSTDDDNDDDNDDEDGNEDEDDNDDLGFGRGTYGGLCLDGIERDARFFDVPCCKHLFACLLTERWGEVLESRMRVRQVTREEMAGLVAGV